jgi:hypothetical protein
LRVFAMAGDDAWDDKIEADLIKIASDAPSAEDIIPVAA